MVSKSWNIDSEVTLVIATPLTYTEGIIDFRESILSQDICKFSMVNHIMTILQYKVVDFRYKIGYRCTEVNSWLQFERKTNHHTIWTQY